MCEMSNSPAAVRTALCSGPMPAYCTGISHPPNGTMRALWSACHWYNGVRRLADMAVLGGAKTTRGQSRRGTAPPGVW